MQTRTIHVSPTPANRKLVNAIRKRPPLVECRFRFLSKNEKERVRQLKRLGPGAVYIWGEGMEHHESYHLTDEGVRVKRNLDHHQDTFRAGTLDPASHMHLVEQRRIKIVSPGSHMVIHNKGGYMQIMAEAVAGAEPNSVHDTVDLDSLVAFPAYADWVYDGGLTIDDIVMIVSMGSSKLRVFDIGGLNEEIPDFALVDVTEPPTAEMTKRVVRGEETDQDVINLVLSYACVAYERILAAALELG